MKERPILFSAPMVRAILEGKKTQTRRVVQPIPQMVSEKNIVTWDGDAAALMRLFDQVGRSCPYGQTGDRLWVRETFQPMFAEGVENHWETDWKTGKGYSISYPATDGVQEFLTIDDELSSACKPSIHMPRWASRILLEITAVRVERLQDISEADALAEGVTADKYYGLDRANARSYSHLWESINGAGSWEANPWVWVVEFKRVSA